MTKTQSDRQHLLNARRRYEAELYEALGFHNEYRDAAGWKQDRTAAQAEMLAGIPPITAFMGMGG